MASTQPALKNIGNCVYDENDYVGGGSFGKVYSGIDQTTNQEVAIKLIKREAAQGTREQDTLQELQTVKTGSGNHIKNVVQLIRYDTTPEYLYLIMELCNGGALDNLIKERGRQSERVIRALLKQLVQGLTALDSRKIMHRDLKPGNILISCDSTVTSHVLQLTEEAFFNGLVSGSIQVKIADFGLARFLKTGLAATVWGTPNYMAPEVVLGHSYDAKADMWSVGAILFELTTGRGVFEGQRDVPQQQWFFRLRSSWKPHVPDDTGTDLSTLIFQLLETEPDKRIGIDGLASSPFLLTTLPRGDAMAPRVVMPVTRAETFLQNTFPVSDAVREGHWVRYVRHNGVPSHAVGCGIYRDGRVLLIGRALFQGFVIPGYVTNDTVHFSFGCVEHEKSEFEVLVEPTAGAACGSRLSWQRCTGDTIPPNAVYGGRQQNDERLYIGRHEHEGCMLAGKVHVSHGGLHIGYGDGEWNYKEFEVLVMV